MGKVGISFAIGGSIAAVIMVIGMITLVADTATPSVSSINIHGYYTLTVTDSEGNIKSVSHGENAPTHLLKDCLFDGYFAATGATTPVAASACSVASTTIAIGDGGEVAGTDASTNLEHRYSNSGSTAGVQSAATTSVTTETTITFDNSAAPISIVQADLDDTSAFGNQADNGQCTDEQGGSGVDCWIDEVAIFDNAGNMLSRADIDPSVLVSIGDQVDVSITITLT